MTMLRTPDDAAWPGPAHDDVDIARDRALVTRAQHGDRSAFDDLYARYYRRLWRFCYKRLNDEHEAEDVVQEAFVRAWRALPGFAGARRFYPWLSVIAAHLCSNVTRRRNRMDPVGEFPERELVSWEDWGEDWVMASHDSETAARAYARLSARHRSVLDLRLGRGWSYQRIAEHQGVRVSTIESLLWRAREALKREFAAEEGAGLTAIAGGLLFAVRRWLRAPQATLQRAATVGSTGTSVLAAAAGMAAGALAVVVVASVPGITGTSPPEAPPGPSVGVSPVPAEGAASYALWRGPLASATRLPSDLPDGAWPPVPTAVTPTGGALAGQPNLPAAPGAPGALPAPQLPAPPGTGQIAPPATASLPSAPTTTPPLPQPSPPSDPTLPTASSPLPMGTSDPLSDSVPTGSPQLPTTPVVPST